MKRSTRGVSLIETLIAAGVFITLTVVAGGLSASTGRMWSNGEAGSDAQQVLAKAVGRLEPTILAARRIDVDQSGAGVLTVVLPLEDSTGKPVLPPQDGKSVSFYLSDLRGTSRQSGTVLWRSINGTPDANWSLRAGNRATDLGTAGLAFSYPAPNTVTLTLVTEQRNGSRSLSRSLSTTLFLRNHE